MRRNTKNISKKAGLKPGSLIYIGESKENSVNISYIHYTPENIIEKSLWDIKDINLKDPSGVHWINVYGLSDTSIIEGLGKSFSVEHLFLEDILNTSKRPKIDDLNNNLFIILKMIYNNEGSDVIVSEQLSIILSGNYVITFQEDPGDVFDPIRDRIRLDKGPIRKKGPDYLCYAIIDAVVDNYFRVLENFEDRIENLQQELVEIPDKDTLRKIYSIKGELIFLKKSVWPLREILSTMYHGDYNLISDSLNIYIKDIYEHLIEVNDTLQLFLDSISNMLDIYLSSMSNKMNEVMKILTIFSTIFIPLTFIAGIYGMNFKYMPELDMKYSYYILWIIMIAITISMLRIFKKKKWF